MHVPVSLSMSGFVSSSNTRVLVVRESKRVYILQREEIREDEKTRKEKTKKPRK